MAQPPKVREAVAVFQSERNLQMAVGDLLTHGFNRSEISLLAAEDVVENKMGHLYRRVEQLEDDASVPRTAFVPGAIGDAEGAVIGGLMYVGALLGLVPILASGGALAGALLAMTIGGGGGAAIGSVLAGMIGKHHADYIEDQMQRGGLLLWVRTWNAGDEARAVEILKSHSGQDVHVHGMPDIESSTSEHPSQRLSYRDISYEKAGASEYYVSGKLFASEAEAKYYIDRHSYVESLYDQARKEGFDLNAALIDPVTAFQSPDALMSSPLSVSLKLELLKRWAYYTNELEISADDGMPVPNSDDGRQEILQLIERLERAAE